MISLSIPMRRGQISKVACSGNARNIKILAAVGKIHEILHKEGSVRLISYLKLETRTDKDSTLAGKKL